MTIRQQMAAVAGVVAVLVIGALVVFRYAGDEIFLVSPGSRAPNFHGALLAGPSPNATAATRSLADYRGSVVLLNVWATWCQPCVVEMPSIERLHRDFAARGLKVVAVSIDSERTDARVRAFVALHQLTFDVLRDPDHAIEEQYQTTGYPETFVIGRDGVIRKKVIGASDWDSPGDRALVTQLLREPAS